MAKGKVVLANLQGKDLERLADLLEMWNFAVFRINEAGTISVLHRDATPLILIFKFQEFSESEYALLASFHEAAPAMPILVLCSFISVKDTFRFAKSGASEYLVEPYSPEDLKRKIAKYLDMGALQPESKSATMKL